MPDDVTSPAKRGSGAKTPRKAESSGRASRPAKGVAVAGGVAKSGTASKAKRPQSGRTPTDIVTAAASKPTKGATLRKKELVERVAAVSGAKKSVVRDIVEATLTVLGDALAGDEMLSLPPFGKAKVNRHKDLSEGEMLVVKLRRPGPAKAGPEVDKDTLAEAAE